MDFLLWFPFALGWILNVIGLSISSRHKMPVLFWISAFAPIIVPACFFGVLLLLAFLSEILEKIEQHWHRNTNQAAATAAAIDDHTLQPESREPPNTNGAHSFNIASLPMHLYDKEAVEGGPSCPICKELFDKEDALVQLPLCIHSFHKECIDAWLQTKLTCPVCRCKVDMEIPREIALAIND
jgi:Ring finger domain